MKTPMKIAALGCSAIGERSLIPAILNSEDFRLQYVASRSAEKGRKFAEKFGCKWCGYDDVFERNDIDAVYVSLPVGLHYQWGKKIVSAGKHLLMEKTFTSNLREAQEIISLAWEKNVIAMEALVYIYHPLFKKVQSIIQSDDLGKVRQIGAYFGFPFLSEDNIRNNFELGGGAILDALIYPLSFCLYTAGTSYKSYTCRVIQDEGREVDCRGFLQIEWNDLTAQIGFGFGFMYRNCYWVWGDKAYLQVDRAFSQPSDLKGEIIIVRQGQVEPMEVEAADGFGFMVNAFAEKIKGTDTSRMNEGEDILTRMKIISQIRETHIAEHGASKKG